MSNCVMFAIHLFNKYLLNFYHVPGTAVGIEAILVKKQTNKKNK